MRKGTIESKNGGWGLATRVVSETSTRGKHAASRGFLVTLIRASPRTPGSPSWDANVAIKDEQSQTMEEEKGRGGGSEEVLMV